MSRENRFEYTDWKNFGLRVRNAREQIGMTKEKFAERINRSDNFVAELEKGHTSCSVHTLHQISKVLRKTTDYLLYGEVADMKENYTNKEILKEIVERCSEEELETIKDVIVSIYPHLDQIVKTKKKK